MELGDPLDPMTFYMTDSLTSVDWPAMELPPELNIPPDLDQEPDWDCAEWLNRGLASNYPTSLLQTTLKPDSIYDIWCETETIFPLLPINSQALRYFHRMASQGYDSKLFDIRASTVPNVILEPRLWPPTIAVLDSWIKKGFVMGPYPSPPFFPHKINGLLGKS